jgi:D-beta-D-heptose 7-phosphate kinase/D-beta-D-heptose 1-phosphate adenosyltransferase
MRPAAIKPNYTEALRLLGLPRLPPGPERVAQIAGCGDRLLALVGCHLAAVTLDADGALLFEQGAAPYRTYSKPVQNSRALGAGDTYVAALTLALASGAPTHAAGELASAAAAVVISKERTSICSGAELTERVLAGDKYIEHLDRLRGWVEIHRSQGRRLVFTNGCFDLLHRGHITYLSRAKTLGDVLIVGVNADVSVSRLKGPSRPINALKDRVDVLAALSCIDHVVSFEEDGPERLIEVIRPDVFVKGGDYTRETIPEAPLAEALGGAVTVLPYEEGCSTTGLIERVGHAYGHASQEVMGL